MKPRNRQAMNPLMRKGGVHLKSKSATRSQQKAKLKKELRVPDLSSFLWPTLRSLGGYKSAN
ncbi:MAG: hypothetical protein ACJAQ6_001309 [Arenicella sp.]|jgi:hypothetical protein